MPLLRRRRVLAIGAVRCAVRGAPARTRRCDNDACAPAGGRIGKSPHAIDARCGIPHRALDSTINDQARW
jgi:hypothetical protein